MNTLITAVWALCREKGISEEAMRDVLKLRTGKASLRACTKGELVGMLDALRGQAFLGKSGWRRTDRGRAMQTDGSRRVKAAAAAATLVNERELQMVRDAAARLGWSDAGLAGFVARQLGRSEIRTMADLNKVFWAMKRIEARRAQA